MKSYQKISKSKAFESDLVFRGGGWCGGRGFRLLGGGVYVCGLQSERRQTRVSVGQDGAAALRC